tara:strand:+ start:2287 stop:2535 length:249 start_codon:yes stop_codon:yes gene_type:complete
MIQKLVKSLNTNIGKYMISIILGLGLASLFRKSCEKRNCLVFEAPPLDEVKNNIYKHNGKCYKFKENSVKCQPKTHKIVKFA